MGITAANVNKLRQQTGAGMMDCKNALVESNGDFDVAVDILRKKGQKVAAKRGDRDASEGLVLAKTAADEKSGVIVVVNCETDFVAKNDAFGGFASTIADVAVNNMPASVEELKNLKFDDSYTIADGLQGNIFVRGAIFRQNNNRIFVGGYYGFNSFFPSDVKSNKYKPATAITDILINNEPFQFNSERQQPISLPYTENDLTFIFSANSFYKSEKNTYAYKLDGFDADWQYVDASTRKARFPNLNAGQYTFRVKSANSSELWNEDPVTIQLEILPAPYKTWWAYIGYGVGALALLVLLFRFLIKNEKVKHELQIEKIEHAKSEKLNQFKLRFFTNISHEILTPLSIISCSLDLIRSRTRKSREEFEIVDRNINQLNRLLHQLLDFRKMEGGHLKLQVEKGDINEFIRNIVTNFYPLANQKNLNLSIKINGKYTDTWFDSDKLDKILDNLISNAIKYTPEGGSVLITSELSNMNGQIRSEISVIDTGQGIKEQDFEKIS